MKTLHAQDYDYLGRDGYWHVFKSVKTRFDPEILYLARARVINLDGSSIYYDPVIPVEGTRYTKNDALRLYSSYLTRLNKLNCNE
jgi:hypothetical protein